MRKNIFFSIVLLIFFVPQSYGQCGWQALQVDDTIQVSFGRASYTSIAQQGVPTGLIPYHYIVYSDGMAGGKASVVYPLYSSLSFTKWAYLGNEGFTKAQANYTSIAMADSIPYVAYQDMANKGKVTVMQYKGGAWSTLGGAGFSVGSATYVSIAATNQTGHDSVYVAYSDSSNGYKLTVMGYNGTKWRPVGTAFSTGASTYNSLQIDQTTGLLYVAFSDGGKTNTVRVFEFTTGAWNEIKGGIIQPSLDEGNYVSLNVSNSNVTVAFNDISKGNQGVVMTFGTILSLVGTINYIGGGPFTPHPVSYVSMATASNGNTFVVYNDNVSGFANVMECNSGGNSWQQWGNPNFSAAQTAYDGIAIITTGTIPFVVYQDSAVADKATVMTGEQMANQPWYYLAPPLGIDTNSYAYTPSVAIDQAKNIPYDTFVDGNDSGKTCAMSYTGGKWKYLGSRISSGPSRDPHIIVNRDTAFVAYIDGPSHSPYVKKFNGSSWVGIGGTGQVTTHHVHSISLAFDNKNQPYLAYDDSVNAGELAVTYLKTGSTWTSLGTNLSSEPPSFVSMAIYNTDVYIAYILGGPSSSAMLEYNTGSWHSLLASPGAAAYTSLAIDGSGNVYEAFQDSTLASKSASAKELVAGPAWDVITPASGLSSGSAKGVSIAIDSLNNPYISFIDGANNGKVTTMEYNGSSWTDLGCAGISRGTAVHTTQLATKGTNVYVTYQDRGAIVKEFNSVNATPTVTVKASPDSIICSGFSTTLTASGATTYTWKPATGLSATSGASVTASPTVTTIYTVIGKKGASTDSAKITIKVNPALAITPALSVICSGDVTLTGSSGASNYVWSTNTGSISCSTCSAITAAPTGTGSNFMLTSSGCPGDTAKAEIWLSGGNDIFTIAGTNSNLYRGDGGPSIVACLQRVSGVAFDSAYQNLYIADQWHAAVRKINMNTDIITTVVGTGSDGYSGDGGQATAAKVYWPTGVAVNKGNLYIADQQDNVIRAVNISSGIIGTIAGNYSKGGGYSGDGSPATAAELYYPSGIAFDNNGNMYIADTWNNRVRKVNTSGIISTFAGTGTSGYSGDGGLATAAKLYYPASVAVDASGNVYIADNSNNRIRKVNTSGTISTVAGDGTAGFSGDGSAATAAKLNYPEGITVDGKGNLYIADSLNERIREVNTSGIINTIAGNGTAGYNADGIPATTAELYDPCQVALDAAGDIYIPDFFNNRIREVKICGSTPDTVKVTANPDTVCLGSSTTLTATGATTYTWKPATGLNATTGAIVTATPTVTTTYTVTGLTGSTTSAKITVFVASPPSVTPALSVICAGNPVALKATGDSTYTWMDSANGSITCSCPDDSVTPLSSTTYSVTTPGCPNDTAKAVIWVSNGDDIFTIAGNGTSGYSGDSGLATNASMYFTTGVAFDSTYRNMYIADQRNQVVRKVNMNTNIITTFAGNGFGNGTVTGGYSGDGGPDTAAELDWPSGVAVHYGSLYIADQVNNVIRKVIISTGIISTVAGNGTGAGTGNGSYSGDGGLATAAELTEPTGIVFDKSGNMYIADQGNNLIRKVNTSGIISTFAGTPPPAPAGYSGDGAAATAAELHAPSSVAIDKSGNVYIADRYNNVIRKVNTSGIINTVAGNGTLGYTGDGSAATTAELNIPIGITVDGTGNLYIADEGNNVIREVNTSGIISTIAGNGAGSYSGDGGPATAAELYAPWAVVLDPAGDIYIPDNFNNRVREVKNCGTTVPITVTAKATQSSVCGGQKDTLIASGAVKYVWSPSTGLSSSTGDTVIFSHTTPTVATTYTYTVVGTDTTGGIGTATVSVTVYPAPIIGNIPSTPPGTICPGGKDSIVVSFDTSGATYFWEPQKGIIDSGYNSGSIAYVNVAPSTTTTYILTVTNGAGCSATDPRTVNVALPFSLSITSSNVTCNGLCNGAATATPKGGNKPFNYTWSNGATTSSVNVLCAGKDTVFVVDSLGCKGMDTVTITQPRPLKDSITQFTGLSSCGGSCNASATDSAWGGTTPYSYSWSPSGGASSSASNLCKGNYTVTVTDKNLCTNTASISVVQPNVLNIAIVSVTNLTCNGDSNGAASVKVSGGTPPYSYFWNTTPVQTTDSATGLKAGTYTCSVIDKAGCHDTISLKITQPSQISATISESNEKCNGDSDATASVTNVTGGTGPYTYLWTPFGGTASSANTLKAGTYTCTITDSKGCSIPETVTITQPNAISVTPDDTSLCSGGKATVYAYASGGTPPYTYLWNNGATKSYDTIIATKDTAFTVTVTDVNGCPAGIATDSIFVGAGISLTQGSISLPSTICLGTSIKLSDTVSGGTGITYTWSPVGETGSSIIVTPKDTGTITYFVTAISSSSCSEKLKDSVTVTIIPAPTYTVCCDSTIVVGQSVKLIASPSVGYTFKWSPTTGLSCDTCPVTIASPTVNTTYSVTATDPLDGCTTTDTVTIEIGNGKIVIYSGFTPNGDGHNDTWIIDNIELYPDNSVSIWNRWGSEVWSGNDYNNSSTVWTGLNSSGQPLPDGTYFYIVKVSGTLYKGWVELTR
ncbi:MAG: gliding motility-associated C-terminal domain-containing protein [Bacteroidia bacterium]